MNCIMEMSWYVHIFSKPSTYGTYCLCSITQLFRLRDSLDVFPCSCPNHALVTLKLYVRNINFHFFLLQFN